MSCGCSGDTGSSGPLLSGQLDPRFASNPAAPSQDESIFGGTTNSFSISGLLAAAVVVAVLVGIAWAAGNVKKERE